MKISTLIQIASASSSSAEETSPSSILSFTIENKLVGQKLKFINEKSDGNLDWLAPHSGPSFSPGTDVSLLLTESDKDFLLSVLGSIGQSDFQVDGVQQKLERMFDGPKFARTTYFDFFAYHDYLEIEDWLTSIDSPLARLDSVGKTYENRNIYVVTIGDDSQTKITVDCGIHAR